MKELLQATLDWKGEHPDPKEEELFFEEPFKPSSGTYGDITRSTNSFWNSSTTTTTYGNWTVSWDTETIPTPTPPPQPPTVRLDWSGWFEMPDRLVRRGSWSGLMPDGQMVYSPAEVSEREWTEELAARERYQACEVAIDAVYRRYPNAVIR